MKTAVLFPVFYPYKKRSACKQDIGKDCPPNVDKQRKFIQPVKLYPAAGTVRR